MDIILVKDVDNLGRTGDEVEVKDGYARNYLIPQGFAVAATESALKQMAEIRETRRKQRELEVKKARETAEKLKKVSCTIAMEVGEEDKLFGAVTASDISEELHKEDIEIDKKQIMLSKPFKELGVYTVKAKLHPEVKTSFRVWVVKKQ